MSMLVFVGSCGSPEIHPVDFYPEDMCSHCRMAISDPRVASEIIDDSREVFKFDDIGCLLAFSAKHSDMKVAAVFVKDFNTNEWIRKEQAVIIDTDIATPMGSGKVAFRDSAAAREFLRLHSAKQQPAN